MVKGLKDENAPTRPLSAYFQWQNSVRAKVAKTMPEGHTVGDMAKKFSEMWGAMSDNQKKPFITKYQTEKAKFDKKMEKYKTTKEYAKFQKAKEQHKLDSVKSKKFKKDENAPSRPLSAYFLFMNDERDDLVAGGMSHKEAMSKLGEMWGNLSAAKKKPYQDKAAAAKAKYDKQVEKYRKTNTYKKYLKEKDEFYAAKKAELKAMEHKRSGSKPKAPKKSASRSKSKKRSARKASKPKAPKRSVSRSKSARKASKPKKAKSRSRSRSKSKARKATKAKKSRSRSKSKAKKKSRSRSRSKAKKAAKAPADPVKPKAPVAEPMVTEPATTTITTSEPTA